MNLRKSGYVVSTKMLQLEASKIAQKVTEFKTSYVLVQQFLNHWQLLIHRTIISQKLPEGNDEK
jgi:hypothetical protein